MYWHSESASGRSSLLRRYAWRLSASGVEPWAPATAMAAQEPVVDDRHAFLAAMAGHYEVALHALADRLEAATLEGAALTASGETLVEIASSLRALNDGLAAAREVSQIVCERHVVEESAFDAAAEAGRVAAALALAAVPREIEIEARLAPELPRLFADRRAFVHVLCNMLDLALMNCARGSRILLLRQLTPQRQMSFSVVRAGAELTDGPSAAPTRRSAALRQIEALLTAHGGELQHHHIAGVGPVMAALFPAHRLRDMHAPAAGQAAPAVTAS
jgi:hypothetical protein